MLDNQTVGAMFWDLNTGAMVDANQTFLDMMGYSRSDVESGQLFWQNLTPPEYLDVSRTEVEKFLATGRVGPYEKEYFCKDGSKKWLLFAGSSLGNNQCVEFCVDISARKKAEEALRTQANLLMQSFDAIIVWRLDGNIEWWNAGAEKLYGFTAAEAVGQETHTLLSTVFPRSWAHVRHELVTNGAWEGELRHHTRDGREVVVSARKQLVRDSSGIERVLETNRDITEKKQAEAALRQSEERYRLLHETMRDAFVQTAMDGRILDCNDAFCDMLGYSEEELGSLRYQDLTPERWHVLDAAKVNGMVLPRGYSDVYEKEYRRKDGTLIPVELRVMLSRDGQGRPETMWAIVRDLSERKHYEEHLRSMRDQLAHVGRLSELAQVSAGIAHELNQPLAAMMNYSNVAKRLIATRDVVHLERAHDAIAKAAEQAERAGLIIRRMRGFIEKRESNRAIESVNAIVEEAVAVGLLGTQGDGITTKLDLGEALPPVYADRLQLQQVVVNLVRNAVEAMAQTSRRELSLSTELNGRNEVVISVRDSGPGLSKEEADRVFMPFFTTKPGGMGIGLVISQSIAEAHGGRLTVASIPGHGAEFRLHLPPAEADTGSEEPQPSWG